jgi:hypothetical protein
MKRLLVLLILVTMSLCSVPVPATAGDVTLAWDASTSSDIVGYKIHMGMVPGGPYTEVRDVGDVLTFVWIGAPDGNACFVATAHDIATDSPFSNECCTNAPPQAPGGLICNQQ